MKNYSVTHLKRIVQVNVADRPAGITFLLEFGSRAVAIANANGITPVYRTNADRTVGETLGRVAPQLALHVEKLLFGLDANKEAKADGGQSEQAVWPKRF